MSKIRNASEIFPFPGKYFSADPFTPFTERGEKLSVLKLKLSTLRFLVSSWEVLWNGKGTSAAPSTSLGGSGITSPLGKQVEHVQ